MKTKTNNTNIKNTLLIIFLIFISYTSGKMLTKLALYNKSHATTGTLTTSFDLAKACISGMMAVVPPAFCWKAGGDFGRIPTSCPNGYFRFIAMCYKNCEPNHYFFLGVCYKNCEPGFQNHPLSCFMHLFHWYFKHSYIPHIITNFANEVPCDGDMYRMGALCYRNCETIGMYNCGIGACVGDKSACATQIIEMGVKVLEGLGTLLGNVLTLGNASAALSSLRVAGKSALKKLGKSAIQAAKNSVKRAFTGEFKKRLFQKFKNKVKVMINDKIKEFIKDELKTSAQTLMMSSICEGVYHKAVGNLSQDEKPVSEQIVSSLISAVDIFGVKGMVDSCSNTTEDKGLGCGKAVVESLSTIDPTGLLTIASAFIHPTCDVPEKAPPIDKVEKNELYDLSIAEIKKLEEIKRKEEEAHIAELKRTVGTREIEEIKKVGKNCVRVYNKIYYGGDSREDCSSNALYDPTLFNDRVESFIVGVNVSGHFFEDANWDGRFISFGRGLVIRDVKDFNRGEINLKRMISSIYIGNSNILSFQFDVKINNFFLDDFPTKKIEYEKLRVNDLYKRGNGIFERRLFLEKWGAKSFSLFIYKPTKVTIEYSNKKVDTITTNFIKFVKDIQPLPPKSRQHRRIETISWT
jgi:hypothetical protein